MKKKITKILGVGLALVLTASLLLWAVPVTAGTLSWGSVDTPADVSNMLKPTSNVVDLAVAGDGTIYAAVGKWGLIYRSTNGGESWSSITVVKDGDIMDDVSLIAVAPDDPNYIAAANATRVFISSDAGANWDTLLTSGLTITRDITLSITKGGRHFVAVAGANATAAKISYYEIGAVGAAWTSITDSYTNTGSGFKPGDIAGAVAFSPNFQSDQVMVAVSANTSASSELVHFQIFSFNQKEWNTDAGAFAGYPVQLTEDSGPALTSLDSASIAMSPDYLGSDDSLRISFVGLALTGGNTDETEGIQRVEDDSNTVLKDDIDIHSIAFDGSRLVAGQYGDNNVRRSADPLSSSPTVSGATSRKRPGGVDKVVVAFRGDDVVAGTNGNESAFSVSKDDGKSFNDISLIDTYLGTLMDVAVSDDGSKYYLLTSENVSGDMSLWVFASRWQRVLSETAVAADFIIRRAPNDADVIYLADVGATDLFYSMDGGMEKWHKRISRYSVTDLAIEGDGDVAYVLTSAHVSTSTNSGFTWDSKKSHKISAGGDMIVSLGEDLLLVGGKGAAAYSKDGNQTWTKLEDGAPTAATQVIATGLDDGDFVFAATDSAADAIYQWIIGTDDEWDNIFDVPSGYSVYGLGLQEGVLYAVSDNGSDSKSFRTLNPTSDDPSWSTMNSAGETFMSTPSALRISRSSDATKLWAIDTTAKDLFSYTDTVATVGPTATGPASGAVIGVNPITGRANVITLTWLSPSDKVVEYDLQIALDSGFDEKVLDQAVASTAKKGEVVSQVVGPYASGNFQLEFMSDTTYYWRVRVDLASPVRSPFSATRTFMIAETEVTPPVIIQPAPPAPVITVPIPPAPAITLPTPTITIPPAPPAPTFTIPAAPAPPAPITPAYIWAVIIIGAILVIAVIVLIVRTRRPV